MTSKRKHSGEIGPTMGPTSPMGPLDQVDTALQRAFHDLMQLKNRNKDLHAQLKANEARIEQLRVDKLKLTEEGIELIAAIDDNRKEVDAAIQACKATSEMVKTDMTAHDETRWDRVINGFITFRSAASVQIANLMERLAGAKSGQAINQSGH